MKNKINIPTNWDKISLDQYIEFMRYNDELAELDHSELDQYEIIFNKIAILKDIDIDDEEIDDLDITELFDIIKNLKWTNYPPKGRLKQKINGYPLKALTSLTLGEYIDLDIFSSEEPVYNLHKIASVLYEHNKEFNQVIEEFLDCPVTSLYPLLEYYYEYRSNIITSYKSIFEKAEQTGDDDVDELDELTGPDRARYIKEQRAEDSKKLYNWEYFVYNLCQGDLTKYNTIIDLPVILVFNMISMKKAYEL